MKELNGKKVLVLGLGESGYSSAKLLSRHGSSVMVSDAARRISDPAVIDRIDELKDLGVRIETGRHSKEFCKNADLVVVSPGIDINDPAVRSALPADSMIIGELELGYLVCRGKIIAVTGTNGKTTTVELLASIFREAGMDPYLCGNIGMPFTEIADKPQADDIVIVEVSSFQLETIDSFKPAVAAILNITDDHYDRHVDMEGYKKAKFRIFKNMDGSGSGVISNTLIGDPFLDEYAVSLTGYGFDGDMLAVKDNEIVVKKGGRGLFKCSDIPIKGVHNIENVLCAATIAKLMSINDTAIRNAVMSFKGIKHRFETVAVQGGISFIDDSKATNIDATKRALESAGAPVIIIAGGKDKGGDYSIIEDIVRNKVKKMILIGESKKMIRRIFDDIVDVVYADDMNSAVREAVSNAVKGDIVLLSPMCSSFDMYKNYKERGEAFRKAVAAIGEKISL